MKFSLIATVIGDISRVKPKKRIGEQWVSLLMGAVIQNQIAAVKELLERGVWINEKEGDGYSALLFAIVEQNVDMVKLLLENGANVNDYDENGETALAKAVFWCNVEMVQLLLKYGAEINLTDGYPTMDIPTDEEREQIQKLLNQYMIPILRPPFWQIYKVDSD